MSDSYLTIRSESIIETRVKGSRFIGESFRAATVDEALTRIEAVRKREYRASHHCYAYIIGGPEVAQFKYSDDGEPSGTAGRPIYDVLRGDRLTNLLVVVTRYFGGTKLGTGGLVRAYGDAARAVVQESGVREIFVTSEYRLTLDFSQYNQWQREIQKLGAKVVDSEFTDRVTLVVSIRRSQAAKLRESFTEITAGKGEFEEISRS